MRECVRASGLCAGVYAFVCLRVRLRVRIQTKAKQQHSAEYAEPHQVFLNNKLGRTIHVREMDQLAVSAYEAFVFRCTRLALA